MAEWTATVNTPGPGKEEVISMEVEDRVYVVGKTENLAGELDVHVMVFDLDGNLEWQAVYNHPQNGNQIPTDMYVSTNGKLYLCGTHVPASGGSEDVLLLRYSSSGSLEREETWDGPDNGADIPTALTVEESSSRVFVTGTSYDASNGQEFFVGRFKENLEESWVQTYTGGSTGDETGTDVIVEDNYVYATGKVESAANGYDMFLIKIAKSSGSVEWSAQYDGPDHGSRCWSSTQ